MSHAQVATVGVMEIPVIDIGPRRSGADPHTVAARWVESSSAWRRIRITAA